MTKRKRENDGVTLSGSHGPAAEMAAEAREREQRTNASQAFPALRPACSVEVARLPVARGYVVCHVNETARLDQPAAIQALTFEPSVEEAPQHNSGAASPQPEPNPIAQLGRVKTDRWFTAELDPLWRDRLAKLAEHQGVSISAYLEQLIRRAWVALPTQQKGPAT